MAGWFTQARLFLVLLAIFTVSRFLMFKVPYERGHQVFSIVTLTLLAATFYGAFGRRYMGYTIGRAALNAIGLGLCGQVVIFLATLLSYGLGMDTYFNHPRALNQEGVASVAFGKAMMIRTGGLFANSLFASLAGAFGWALGALLPPGSETRR